MFDIIICEDNDNQRQQIETIVKDTLKKMDKSIDIALSADNPEDIIRYLQDGIKNTYLYFLDIDLRSDINGVELAKKIRRYDPMGYIVFVTSHAELTMLTFEYKVQAMDYIVKNNLDDLRDKIADCINEAYNDRINSKSLSTNSISVNIGNTIKYFNLDDILFFETTGKDHKIRIHTVDEQIEFYGTLREIEKKVTKDYYKPHRSYLVNTKKIKSIDKEALIIHMINDECCYIAARYLKGLLKKCTI